MRVANDVFVAQACAGGDAVPGSTAPRGDALSPGSRAEIGLVNSAIGGVIRLGTRTKRPPRVFTTLARHRGVGAWLRFAGRLMPGGSCRGRTPSW